MKKEILEKFKGSVITNYVLSKIVGGDDEEDISSNQNSPIVPVDNSLLDWMRGGGDLSNGGGAPCPSNRCSASESNGGGSYTTCTWGSKCSKGVIVSCRNSTSELYGYWQCYVLLV